jgi:DNA polymerase-3 subunit epsilon
MTHKNTIIVYDTETTDMPLWDQPSEDPRQPRIIQIAAAVVDVDTRTTLEHLNFIITPNGWTISDKIAEMTGITQERALHDGVPIESVLPLFLSMHDRATIGRVAHNQRFDERMVRIEMMKAGIYTDEQLEAFKTAAKFDTCTESTKIVNLPPTEKMLAAKRKNPKPPNLEEAYEFFTGLKLEGAHNADVDVMACKTIYFAIQDYKAATKAA